MSNRNASGKTRALNGVSDTLANHAEQMSNGIMDNFLTSNDEAVQAEVSSASIMDRIMQIREYLKQASTLKKQLISVGGGAGDNRQNYEQLSKISSLIVHLREQESGYMSLLSQLLGEAEISNANGDTESVADTVSINLDAHSEMNDERSGQNSPLFPDDQFANAYDGMQFMCEASWQRYAKLQSNCNKKVSMINRPKTPVPGQMPEMRLAINGPTASGRSSAEPRSQHQNVGITRQPQSSSAHAETAQLNGPASELMELKRQHELLEKLLNQQKELKDLKTKHDVLKQMTSNSNQTQTASEVSDQEAGPSSQRASSSHPRSSDSRVVQQQMRPRAGSSGGRRDMPQELVEEKTSLQSELQSLLEEKAFLTQLLKMRATGENANGSQRGDLSESSYNGTEQSVLSTRQNQAAIEELRTLLQNENQETISAEDLENVAGLEQQLREKRELEARLQELQDKKSQMDQLVQHLQALKQASVIMNGGLGEAPQGASGSHESNQDLLEIEDIRHGGAESADDPGSQNSEHSGIRHFHSLSAASGLSSNAANRESTEAPENNDTDDEEDEYEGDSALVRLGESDHRTSSEMIADLMDSEERMRKLQEYQSRLQQMKTLVDMYQTAAANPRNMLTDDDGGGDRIYGHQCESNYEDDEDDEQNLGAVGGAPLPGRQNPRSKQVASSSKSEHLSAKIQEIEHLKSGIEQLQGLISNVQSSTNQITSAQMPMPQDAQTRLNYLLNHRSDDEGLGDRLDQLRHLLKAAGSNMSAEEFIMSDNEQDFMPRAAARNGDGFSRAVRQSVQTESSGNSRSKSSEKRPKAMSDFAAIVPSQREVEGSVDSPTSNVPPAVSAAMSVPQLSGQQLKSNKEMWLEMRQQRMQREEAKNRARGRFGDGQSEDSIQETNPFRLSLSTTSATYGGSPVTSQHPRNNNGSSSARAGLAKTHLATRYSMDSLMSEQLARGEGGGVNGTRDGSMYDEDDDDVMMMQQAEEEEEEDEEGHQNADNLSSSSNETYTLDDLNKRFKNLTNGVSASVRQDGPVPSSSSGAPRVGSGVTLMPDNRKTDNRVAASRANPAKTKNQWTRNTSRQRKQENISTVPDIALNTSQLSNATSSTMIGSGNQSSSKTQQNTSNQSQRTDDVRSMFRELKDELASTNDAVRNMQAQIQSRELQATSDEFFIAPRGPIQPRESSRNSMLPPNPISMPALPGPFGNPGSYHVPQLEDLMRSMEAMMRQQMMMQMSSMYSNMTMAWSQNNMPNSHRYAGNSIPGQCPNNWMGGQSQQPPALGFISPQMVNPWFPNENATNMQNNPNMRFPTNNPYLSDEASIHSLSTTDQTLQHRMQQMNQNSTNSSFNQNHASQQLNIDTQNQTENLSRQQKSARSSQNSQHVQQEQQQNLSKSWPAPVGASRTAPSSNVRQVGAGTTNQSHPEIPPLGLESGTTSVDSSNDFFVQTYPNVDRSRRFINPNQHGIISQKSPSKRESQTSSKPTTVQSTPVVRRKVKPSVEEPVSSSAEAPMESDSNNTLSLFDALRDNIYSELASVITENESRPHFLIELFRELKMLKTDYLRQRALMLLQDLVNRYIAEDAMTATDAESSESRRAVESVDPGDQINFTDLFQSERGKSGSKKLKGGKMKYPHYLTGAEPGVRGKAKKYTAGEETPSDMSDQSGFSVQNLSSAYRSSQRNSQDKYPWIKQNLEYLERIRQQYRQQEAQNSQVQSSSSSMGGVADIRIQGHPLTAQHYDYEEVVEESHSGQSTPLFAKDSLGDTAIYLDTVSAANAMATASAPKYQLSKTTQNSTSTAVTSSANSRPTNSQENAMGLPLQDISGFESDSSFPDHFATPNINSLDTQHLDDQIKMIMGEIIPQMKNRMDENCTQSFLNMLKKQVLQLASAHYDGAEEFVRFFHQQLTTVLTEALSKFANLTLRECGEDLLVEISEVLFNELAFFRMMRSFDGGTGSMSIDEELIGLDGNQEDDDDDGDADENDDASDDDGDEDDDDEEEEEEESQSENADELGEASEEVRETDHGSSTTTQSMGAESFNREAEELSNERDDILAMTAPSGDHYDPDEDEDDVNNYDNDLDSVLSDAYQNDDLNLNRDMNLANVGAHMAGTSKPTVKIDKSADMPTYARPLILSDDNTIPMLSMSETRALISYGSGEDDDEDEVISQDELLAAVEEQTAVVTTSNRERAATSNAREHSNDLSNSDGLNSESRETDRHMTNLMDEIMDSMTNASAADEMIEDNAAPQP